MSQSAESQGVEPQSVAQPSIAPKSRTTVALLALFLGNLGIHQFYLGNKVSGIIRIVLTLTFYGALISFLLAIVELVMYLATNDEDFHKNHVVRRKAFPWSTPSSRDADASSKFTEEQKLIMVAIVGIVLVSSIGNVVTLVTVYEFLNQLDNRLLQMEDRLDQHMYQNARTMDLVDRVLDRVLDVLGR